MDEFLKDKRVRQGQSGKQKPVCVVLVLKVLIKGTRAGLPILARSEAVKIRKETHGISASGIRVGGSYKPTQRLLEIPGVTGSPRCGVQGNMGGCLELARSISHLSSSNVCGQ